MSKAIITKSKSSKKPFKVRILADNNEVLSHHLLTTRLNVRKNLLAIMEAFHGKQILIEDRTTKKVETYYLCDDGGISDIARV